MYFDYVIVGGGLSGATLGYLLKKQGKEVIILEKQSLSKKDKLCGGIITTKTYNILVDLFPKEEIDALIQNYFSSVTIKINHDPREVNDVNLRVVQRKKLDDYLINKYISLNGQIIECCQISNIDFEHNLLTVNDQTIYFTNLIGADGVFSQVRKNLLGANQNFIFGYESFQEPNSEVANPIVEFNYDQLGYNLIMPVGNKLLLGSSDIFSKEKCLVEYEKMVRLYDRNPSIRRGGFTPTGAEIFLRKDNVFLIGDAAGLIQPVTGEGIYYALVSALALYKNFANGEDYEELMLPILSKIKLQMQYAGLWTFILKLDSELCYLSILDDEMLTEKIRSILDF